MHESLIRAFLPSFSRDRLEATSAPNGVLARIVNRAWRRWPPFSNARTEIERSRELKVQR